MTERTRRCARRSNHTIHSRSDREQRKVVVCALVCVKNSVCQVMCPGKRADMSFILRTDIRVLILDVPRNNQGENFQYDFLEDVKNGYIFSPKYESSIKTLANVHLVVLMNEPPDLTKLSSDRFKITCL